jgi:ribosomal protein S17E
MKQYYYQILGDCQSIQMSSDEINDDYFTNKKLCQRVANREARDMSKFHNQYFTAVIKELETV